MTPTKEVPRTTATPEPPVPHWAGRRGTEALARRRQRLAEQEAATAADAARQSVPVDVVCQRFARLAAPIAEAVSAWSAVTGAPIDSEATVGSLRLALYGLKRSTSLQLLLMPPDGAARVTIRGDGRGDERVVALDAPDFEPEALARAIAEEFLGHAEAITELEEITR